MRKYRIGPHTRYDCKVHLVWIPKYRKAVLVGPVALRVRDLIRQMAMERELDIISGKGARNHVHLFLSYRPHQDISTIAQWLKGTSRGFSFRSSRTSGNNSGVGTCGPADTSP